MVAAPSAMWPSTGIVSPAEMLTRSLTLTASSGVSTSAPSTRIRTVRAS